MTAPATLERALLQGYQLWRTDPDDGQQRFFVGCYGIVRAFSDLDAVVAWLDDAAGQRLGISTRQIYTHIATGELRSFKAGKRRLIPETELQQFVARRMAEAVAA